MSPTFRSLRVPNYRLWTVGALVSNTGTWMQRVAQDWLVLTELTADSGVAVGITTGFQFGPVLLLAPMAGAVADRFDRRRVLMATQTASGVLALVLGLLVLTDTARLWHVYLLAGLLGCVAALDGPARHAFVSELVGAEDLPNAVGLNSASFHAGRLIGPGIAGMLIHWFGTGPVFLVNAVSFGAVWLALSRMRVSELREIHRSRGGRRAVRAGLSYVRHRPDIMIILLVVGMVGTFGLNFQLTTALMARLVFDKGPQEYGILGSIMAIGSLTGALLAARRERPDLRLVIGATLVFGVVAGATSLMPTYTLFAVALVPTGLSALTLMTAANAAVLLSTPPEMRGRVSSLYMAIFMGGTPIGAPVIGWIAEQFGARWSILLGGIVSVATALVAAFWARRGKARACAAVLPPRDEAAAAVVASGGQVAVPAAAATAGTAALAPPAEAEDALAEVFAAGHAAPAAGHAAPAAGHAAPAAGHGVAGDGNGAVRDGHGAVKEGCATVDPVPERSG